MGTWNPGPGATSGSDSFTGADGVDEVANALGGDDTLTGGDGDDILFGGAGFDVLDGGDGNDQLIGVDGRFQDGRLLLALQYDLADRIDGGAGEDFAAIHYDVSGAWGAKDIVFDASGPSSAVTSLLVGGVEVGSIVNVESFYLWLGSSRALTIKTGDGDDRIIAYGGSELASVETGAGNDSIDMSGSNVFADAGAGDDFIQDLSIGGTPEHTILGGTGDDHIYLETVGNGVVALNGGADNDTLTLDFFYLSGVEASFTLNASNLNSTLRMDGVATAISATGFEHLNIYGAELDDTFIGGASGDLLSGGAGDDALNGRTGADTLMGGLGANTLNGGADTDTADYSWAFASMYDDDDALGPLQFRADLALASNQALGIVNGDVIVVDQLLAIENLVGTRGADVLKGNDGKNALSGGLGDDLLAGRAGNDTLNGGDGADVLDGGAGADKMSGGAGADLYGVDNFGDVVIEAANAGIDRVNSYVTFTLSTNVEQLTLRGEAAISGFGNAVANTITGNAAANTLDGGAGADTLIGGRGNDKYIVDHSNDMVVESAGGGSDAVFSSISYSLASNVEHLTLTGIGDISGSGNELNNNILGNAGANLLNGGDGNDILKGGAGSDALFGGFGDDVMFGGAGADAMYGGPGADTFVFDAPLTNANRDTITEFDGAEDVIRLDRSIFTALHAGTLSAAEFQTAGGGAATPDVHIIFNAANGKLFYDPDGSGAASAIWFASLEFPLSLTNADFVVV